MTSTERLSCFLICSNVLSSPYRLMVMRETVGSSVSPTVRLNKLYDLPENSPEIFASTPTSFSTYRETHLFFAVSISGFPPF